MLSDNGEREKVARMQRLGQGPAGGGRGLLREIREFATRGNVLDLAVGVTVGAAVSQGFTRLSSSLINDLLAPVTGLFSSFSLDGLFLNLSGRPFNSLAEAKAAGAPVIAYGQFLSQIFDFLLVALILMVVMRGINRFKRGQEEEPVARECPYCLSSIPLKATRCRFCTSQLEAQPEAQPAAAAEALAQPPAST